jgi:hypothetical protein
MFASVHGESQILAQTFRFWQFGRGSVVPRPIGTSGFHFDDDRILVLSYSRSLVLSFLSLLSAESAVAQIGRPTLLEFCKDSLEPPATAPTSVAIGAVNHSPLPTDHLSLALANFKRAHWARGMRNIGSFSTIS